MNRNTDYEASIARGANYEAGFTRAANHDEVTPEELLARQKRKARAVRLGVAAVIVVGAAAAAGTVYTMRRDSPAKQVERGLAFSSTNSHVAATIEFKRSLQEDPNQPEVRVLLGQELSLLNDARGAEIEFRKAADAKFNPDKTIPLLATSLLHQGKFDKVIELVNGVQVDGPEANSELLSLRGSAYFALGREVEAEASWKAAREFVPGNPATVMAEARALASKGRYADAAKILDTISSQAPKVELLSLRGELARASGNIDESVTNYQAALKIEPGNLFIRESLAQSFVELGRYDEASDQIKRVLLPKPKYANAHYIAALVAVGKKNFETANDAATKAVQLAPADGRYQLLAGKIDLQLEHPLEAEQHLRAAVTLLPQSAEARRLLAVILVNKHEANKADELFRPVFEAARGNRDIATIAARIAMLQGNPAKAAAAFDQVDPADPANADATILAASLRIRAGDKAGGFARLRAASAANPQNANIDAAIVMSYLTFSDVKEATAAWNALSQKEPKTARTYNLLAGIEVLRKDKAAARRAMQQAIDVDPRYLPSVSGLAMLDIGDKKPDDAKNRLRAFVVANPANVEATMLLLQLERSYGNRQEVILALLQDALKTNPRSAQLTYALVGYHGEHGDPKQALAIAERGLTYAPDDANLLQFVGDHAIAVGENDRAIALFGRLMDQNASSPDYPTRLGVAQLAAGRTEEALTAFRLALTRDPYNQDRQIGLVTTLLAAGKNDEAARMLFEISRIAPKSPVIPELEADVKLGMKQYPEAIAAYRRALAQKPGSRLAIKTFNGLATARLRGEANTFIADWLKAHPGDEQVRYFDGEYALRTRDYGRASNAFRVLVAAHPNDPVLLNNLAWSLSRLNDPQGLVVAEKAGTLAPDNPAVADTLGWLLVEHGDADRGLTLIEKAHSAVPDALEIRLHLAKAQLKKGRNDDARATLQSVVATAPESEEGKASRALLSTF